MAAQKYSAFHKFTQKVGSTRIGVWFASRILPYFDRVLLKRTNGRTTLTTILTGIPVVQLTSIGAKSGLPRVHSLFGVYRESDSDVFAFIGTNFGRKQYPAWYYNLKENPVATCSIKGQVGEYEAHEATGEEYERFWQAAQAAYVGFPNYKQRVGERDIPIMVMTPVTA